MEKRHRVVQFTDENVIQRMRYACWITTATDTPSEYVIIIAFHGKIHYAKVPQYYVYTFTPSLYLSLACLWNNIVFSVR